MFFGAGKITEAFEKGDERRKNARAENARLYSNFIAQNPGATTQERLDFANKLIAASGAGSVGLPTKAQMEANYQKYQHAQAQKAAAAAAAEKSRVLREKMQMLENVDRVGKLMGGAYGSDGFNDMIESTAKEFGIDDQFVPAMRKAAEGAAYADWASANKTMIDSYTQNPTKAGYDALVAASGGMFGGRLSSGYEGLYKQKEGELVLGANAKLLTASQNAETEEDFLAQAELITQGVPEQLRGQLKTDQYGSVMKSRKDEKDRNAIALAGATLERAAQSARSIEEYNAIKAEEIKRLEALGVTVDDTAFSSSDSVAAKANDKRVALSAASATDYMNNTGDIAMKAVLANDGVADDFAAIQEGIRVKTGDETFTLTDEHKAKFSSLMDAGKRDLLAKIGASATASSSDPQEIAKVQRETREAFVSRFMETTSAASGLQNPDSVPELVAIANAQYDAIMDGVRRVTNEGEKAKVEDVTKAMAEARSPKNEIGMSDIQATIEASLMTPEITGVDTKTTKMVAQNAAVLKVSTAPILYDLAAFYDVPLTRSLVEATMREVPALLQTEGGMNAYTIGDKLDRATLAQAFSIAVANGGIGTEHDDIENQSIALALHAVGANSLGGMNAAQASEYRSIIGGIRQQVIASKYDITMENEVADFERSATVISSAPSAIEGLSKEASFFDGVKAMTPEQLAESNGIADVINGVLNTSYRDAKTMLGSVNSEIMRLNKLASSSLYDTSGASLAKMRGQISELERIADKLTSEIERVNATMRHLGANDARVDELRAASKKKREDDFALRESGHWVDPSSTDVPLNFSP